MLIGAQQLFSLTNIKDGAAKRIVDLFAEVNLKEQNYFYQNASIMKPSSKISASQEVGLFLKSAKKMYYDTDQRNFNFYPEYNLIYMFTFTRKLALRSYFSKELKSRTIILSNDNNFTNYSFLEIKLEAINSEFSQTSKNLNWQSLNSFLSALNQRRHILKQLSNDDFGHKDLQAIQNRTNPISPIVKKYVTDIVTLRESYIRICSEISQKIIESNNIFQWLRICICLQIMELNVWSKLLANCGQKFMDYSLSQQNMIISYVHYYLKQKFMSFTFIPSKFIYRQNYLNDLTNFRELIKQFLLSVAQNHQGDNLKVKIEKINDIIEKVSKTVIMDFNELIEIFIQERKQFQKIIQKGSNILLQILRLLSIIGYYQQSLFNKIYLQLNKNWKVWSSTTKKEDKINFVSRMLGVWANTAHFKVEIYYDIIKPFLITEIQVQSNERNHSIWLYNMVAAGINDYDFLELFRTKIAKDIPMSNKYLHIVHHYLSLINNTKGYCTYAACKQVDLVQEIIKNNHGKAYLNCMQRKNNQNQIFNQSQDTNLNFMKKSRTEDNPPEDFWLKIANKAYQNISKKHPHAKNQIIFNFSFCVFQIDALIIINNNYIAFELSGSHYNLKDGKSVILNKTQGKKILKQQIIKGYGLKMLSLNSTNTIEKNINSFNDFLGGVKYFSMKLEEILSKQK